jgi:hypothetical protein
VSRCADPVQPAMNDDPQTWKACWVQALRSSNLLSSATPEQAKRRVGTDEVPALRACWSQLASSGRFGGASVFVWAVLTRLGVDAPEQPSDLLGYIAANEVEPGRQPVSSSTSRAAAVAPSSSLSTIPPGSSHPYELSTKRWRHIISTSVGPVGAAGAG